MASPPFRSPDTWLFGSSAIRNKLTELPFLNFMYQHARQIILWTHKVWMLDEEVLEQQSWLISLGDANKHTGFMQRDFSDKVRHHGQPPAPCLLRWAGQMSQEEILCHAKWAGIWKSRRRPYMNFTYSYKSFLETESPHQDQGNTKAEGLTRPKKPKRYCAKGCCQTCHHQCMMHTRAKLSPSTSSRAQISWDAETGTCIFPCWLDD